MSLRGVYGYKFIVNLLDPISNPEQNSYYTVNWNSVAGATSYELSEQFNEQDWTVVYSGALLTKDFSGKAEGTWSYRVRATDGSDWSGFSGVQSTNVGALEALTSKFSIAISTR